MNQIYYWINDVVHAQEDFKEWRPMRRAYGAVWDTANPPSDTITLRFQATGIAGYTYWVQSIKAIPKDWKPGVAYDSGIQLPY